MLTCIEDKQWVQHKIDRIGSERYEEGSPRVQVSLMITAEHDIYTYSRHWRQNPLSDGALRGCLANCIRSQGSTCSGTPKDYGL